MEIQTNFDVLGMLWAYLPFLIPLAAVQLGLMIAAVVHILKHDRYKMGSRGIWIVICVLVNIIGPVLYFTIGRGED